MKIGRLSLISFTIFCMFLSVLLVAPATTAQARNESVVLEEELGMVDINTASFEDLQQVRGIGPTIAQRIIDYRDVNGKFESIEDLVNVKGIGGSKFQKIKSQISV